jgi:hypothetical protein
MKLEKIDIEKLEQGAWVGDIPEMGELRLKTRGANNRDYRKLQTKLIAAIPRQKRVNVLDPDESDRITAILLRDTCLLDWDGIVHPETGEPLPYSKEQAWEFLSNPEYGRKFLLAAVYAAEQVGDQRQEEQEQDSKNLLQLSTSSSDSERKSRAG